MRRLGQKGSTCETKTKREQKNPEEGDEKTLLEVQHGAKQQF